MMSMYLLPRLDVRGNPPVWSEEIVLVNSSNLMVPQIPIFCSHLRLMVAWDDLISSKLVSFIVIDISGMSLCFVVDLIP